MGQPPRLKALGEGLLTALSRPYVTYRVQSPLIKEMGPLILVIFFDRRCRIGVVIFNLSLYDMIRYAERPHPGVHWGKY